MVMWSETSALSSFRAGARVASAGALAHTLRSSSLRAAPARGARESANTSTRLNKDLPPRKTGGFSANSSLQVQPEVIAGSCISQRRAIGFGRVSVFVDLSVGFVCLRTRPW
jgi:hypothetical protein